MEERTSDDEISEAVKLSEALTLVQKPSAEGTPFPILLACGFSPLHLQTFLLAHLLTLLVAARSELKKFTIQTGLYGSLTNTLEQLTTFSCLAGALFLEWPDLDARLGYRSLGGWGTNGTASVIASAEETLARLLRAIEIKPAGFRLVISLPTLPLPPGFHTVGWQASTAETRLEAAVSDFSRQVSLLPGVMIVNRQKLDKFSPPGERYDFRADLNAGFPYTLKHTDTLAAAVTNLLLLPPPKKGLISDLDDTLWRGIVGEDGPDQVAWDLANHAQLHGLYQQMLQSLAEQGVMLGVASKNNAETAEKALQRSDLVVKRNKIFPAEIHWEAKSGSVSRVLKTWNVAADSVVFVDDSSLELEEVRAAHPGITCILFPKNDYAGAFAFLQQLRDLFGKPALSEEDSLRLESIRQGQAFLTGAADGDLAERFLASAEAVITLEWTIFATEPRVLELVNKTNQFNLNGKRYTESEWQQRTNLPGAFVVVVAYRDKFGPLGKIAVIAGQEDGKRLQIDTWVISCRAFSRRIEHQILHQLFERTAANSVEFSYAATSKNGPVRDFLAGVLGGTWEGTPSVEKSEFAQRCPTLYHQVGLISKDEETSWTTQQSV